MTSLAETSISVDSIGIGSGSVSPLAVTNGALSFATGGFTGVSGSEWVFGSSGSSISITGNTSVVNSPPGALMNGVLTGSPVVFSTGGVLDLSINAVFTTVNPAVATYFGLPGNVEYSGTFTLIFGNSAGLPAPPSSFTSDYVSSGSVLVSPTSTPTINTPSITTAQQPTSASFGSPIADQATVTGLASPGSNDSVTFNLYSSSTTQNSSTLLFTDTEPLTINGSTGTATSASFPAPAAGTDYWVATFNGDTNNAAVSSTATAEPVNIDAITTSQTPATAAVGTSIGDTATISGLVSPTGTVTFSLYNNATGTGTALYTSPAESLTATGTPGVYTATSPGYAATAGGTDYWVATYSGDSSNAPLSSGTASEPVVITVAISGYVYEDNNTNDVYDSTPTDTPIAGVTVELLSGSTVVGTTTTNSSGYYSFTGLTPGTYTVEEVTPVGTGPLAGLGLEVINVGTVSATPTGTVSYPPATPQPETTTINLTANGVNYDFGYVPVAINTVQEPSSAAVGTAIADKATVTGGVNPTGSVTFSLYNNPSASGTPLVTYSNVALVNGVATSPSYTTTAGGVDYWVATYSGDSNNSPVSSGTASEPVSLFVTISGYVYVDTNVNGTFDVGDTPIAGVNLTLTGITASGPIAPEFTTTNASGYYSFGNLQPGQYTVTEATTVGTGPLSGLGLEVIDVGMVKSATAGTAAYPVGSSSAQITTINLTANGINYDFGLFPVTINTSQQPASAAVGTSVADQATVTSSYNLTGTVTFYLYNNSAGTGTPLYTSTPVALSGGTAITNGYTYTATSPGYVATAAGTDYWVATYNGNYPTVTSGTGLEPVTINKVTPAINTAQQPASVVIGNPIADQATVSGGYNPTGTVTFKLYSSATTQNSTTLVDTDANEPLNSNGVATSEGYLAPNAGTYYWVATYNGDGNNAPVSSTAAAEPVTVNKATPTITTTASETLGGVVGSAYLKDSVTISNSYTGMPVDPTVTFTLTAPDGTMTTQTITVGESGTYSATPVLATEVGTYTWSATFSGDNFNNSASDNGANETVTTVKASPSINTAQQPAYAMVGSSISDIATVSGGYNPTGTVTFYLYNNSAGTGTPLFTSAPVTLSGGVATSPGYTATATGTDYWVAAYSGDSNNTPVISGTALEPVNIDQITTSQQPASAVVGSSIADQATVTGVSPTGCVTFYLYSNSAGTGTPLYTSPMETLSGGVATSPGYIATSTGTDYWVAVYGGDSNNAPITSGTASEPVVISPATPVINTSQQPASATIGTSIADKATVTGGYSPTGTVTFNLYSNATASGTPLATYANVALVGGVATSPGYTATATGTDYWVATYNGNSNNVSVSSLPTAEPVVISLAAPAINTSQQPATATVGSSIADKATVTGGDSPTGSVTFKLYSSATTQNSSTLLYTATNVALSGGSATSPGYTATAAGTDYWVATYNGDSNNASVTSGAAAEPVTITPLGPWLQTGATPGAVTLTTGSSAVLNDIAALEYGYNPTGTITFKLTYNSTVVYTDVVTVNGNTNSSANTNWYVTTAGNNAGGYTLPSSGTIVGDYQWSATYNGDGNNSSAQDQGGSAEQVVVSPATPTINTSQQPATATVGGSIADQATVTGYHPTGTVTFKLYSNSSASGTPLVTDSNVALVNGVATSPTYGATAAGTDYWVATYNGDSNNSSVTSAVAAEPVVINKATPTLSTVASITAGGVCGTAQTSDSATLSGGYGALSGTITFSLTYPNGTTYTIGSVTITAGGTYSSTSVAVTQVGTYTWHATYSGNSLDNGVSDNGVNESVSTAKASPTIATTPGGTIAMGSGAKLTDSATIASGYSPTGTVTFYLFAPNVTPNGSDSNNVYSDTVTVSGDGTYTTATGTNPGGFTPTAAGTYQWVAVYSGDGSNNGAVSSFGSEPECVTPPTGTGVITGTKYLDATGNGFSANEPGLGGVTINLYKDVSGNGTLGANDGGPVASTVTASNGTYSFTGLVPGTYFVQEVVPSGYVQTGGGPNGSAGDTYYTVSVSNGQTYSGNNFDDYQIPTCQPTNICYTIYNGNCQSSTVGYLTGNTAQGEVVTVTFTVTAGMSDTLGLVSYRATGPTFDSSTAYQQQIYDLATGTFGPGTHTLTVCIPDSYYQIDFICGQAINILCPQNYGPDSTNIFYTAQERLLSYDNGGTNAWSTSHQVCSGDYATSSFWCTTNGQNLIKACNGSASSTCLAQWLVSSYPNIFGSGCTLPLVNSNGTCFTNTQVAQCFTQCSATDQQVLSAALSIYCTSADLCGSSAASMAHYTCGLNTSGYGNCADNYSVGNYGSSFGVSNNYQMTVMQLLYNLDSNMSAGSALSTGANAVFSGINTVGNVKNATLSTSGVAYDPAQIRTAYGVNNLSLDGTGQTIAIVDAYDNPAIFQAVDTFDAQVSTTAAGTDLYDQYGPASSFLTVLNQSGSTTSLPAVDPTGGWEVEEELDVEWAHAMAPGAQIVLVEANSQSLADLMTSVQTAASQPGVSVVSMSWGFAEGQSVLAQDEALYDSYLTTPAGHQGVTFIASTGDYGTADPEYPAFSPNVLSVGGTSLFTNSDSSYNSETAWGGYSSSAGAFLGSGGGLSAYETEPAYQLGVQSTGYRTAPDVSFVADPNTGVWIADSYNLSADNPWEVVGGTSVSAPSWAGLIALANQGRAQDGNATLGSAAPNEAQQALYSLPQTDLNSITSGTNFGYNAQAGYNLVTGLGTPIANLLIPDLASYQWSADSVANNTAGVQPLSASNAVLNSGGSGYNSELNVVHNVFDVEFGGSFGAESRTITPINLPLAAMDHSAGVGARAFGAGVPTVMSTTIAGGTGTNFTVNTALTLPSGSATSVITPAGLIISPRAATPIEVQPVVSAQQRAFFAAVLAEANALGNRNVFAADWPHGSWSRVNPAPIAFSSDAGAPAPVQASSNAAVEATIDATTSTTAEASASADESNTLEKPVSKNVAARVMASMAGMAYLLHAFFAPRTKSRDDDERSATGRD